MNSFVFSSGDINGIGPEICIKTFNRIYNPSVRTLTFVCPANIFENLVDNVKPNFKFKITNNAANISPEFVNIINLKNARQSLGKPTKSSGKTSYESILKSLEIINKGKAEALITAPISKYAFSLAGIDFPGHTELLASKYNVSDFVMFFISRSIKVGLVTIHEPVKSVAKNITKIKLRKTINVMRKSLHIDFGKSNSTIAVLGLNPHAGENGKIGLEEMNIIAPVIEEYDNVEGPFVPDAFFGNQLYKKFDAVIGMYHDQVLIPFKMLQFYKGINFTAGLPIVRTSPDHGTAFDIAGKYIANETSIFEAFKWAEKILKNRKKNIND